MSFRDELASSSSDDDGGDKGCLLSSRMKKMNEHSSAIVDNDSNDDHAETFDHSSDDSNENDDFDHTNGQKRHKKRVNPSKSKVKIKTLTIDGQLVYFCKICDKIFTRRKDKLNHELAHSGESVLTCTECGKEYMHESSLASHMRTHAGDPLFMCDLCPKMFAQSHHLKSHILSHSEPTNFVCKTCYIEFPTSSDLSHHNRAQSKLEMANYFCKMCKVYFCRSHKLTCDKRLHAFCCSACNELFCTHKKLKIHVKKFAHYSIDKPKYIEPLQEHELYPDKVQDGLKKLQTQKENDAVRKPHKNDLNGKRHCEQDLEVPLKRFKLSVRKLILDEDQSSTSVQDSAPEAVKEIQVELKSPTKHRKGKPYCKKCNKSFKDSVDLDRHKAMVHEEKPDSFACQICSMEFSLKDDLDKHSFLHNGEHTHTCPVCGQEFRNSMQLTKHLRIHVGDFPYKCSQCGRAFRLKIQLIQHVRLHMVHDANTSGKCPRNASAGQEQDPYHCEADTFKCHLCDKKFLFRYKLLNHLRLHTNVKCFQCYVCHKTFATKCYLQRHLQVHVKQGIDVDPHNIIIDDDSKLELDNVKDKITRDYIQNNEDICSRNIFDTFEREDMKKPFTGIKRSVSNFELACRAKQCYSASFDKFSEENEDQTLNFTNTNIKVELPDHIDSVSEHSFCSSFTRDSERSDPFKFSSDESYTFKTAMAKERRRLRRRLRKSQCIFEKSNLQALTPSRRTDLNARDECLENVQDHEKDVTDMVIEVNTVRSEHNDVTTVYVNLTHKKLTSPAKRNAFSELQTGSIIVENTPLSKCKLNIKDEIEETQKDNNSELLECGPSGKSNAHKVADKSGAKTLMFEFDVGLDGSAKQFDEVDVSLTVSKQKEGKPVNQEHKEQVISETNNSKEDVLPNVPKGNDSAKSVPPAKKKSPLKFITPNSSMVSECSNLEKLQAVFEHSSKYLPLPHTSSTQNNPSLDHLEVGDKLTPSPAQEEVKYIPENVSIDTHSSSNLQDNLTAQGVCGRESRGLPSVNAQNRIMIDSKQQGVIAPDIKIEHCVNPGHESRIARPHSGHVSERTSKCKSTTSETSNKKSDVNAFTHKDVKESNIINNRNMNVVSSSASSSHIFQDINSSSFTNSLSHTMNAVSVSHVIPQQSNHCSSGLISHPQFSVTNAFNYYPVVGNSGTDLSHLQSGLSLPQSPFMNLNQFLGPVCTRDFSADTLPMSSGCSTHHLNTQATFDNCLISTNPLVNQSMGLNTSANQNLQFAVNQDCFHLNSSAIFDASNPVYRDMNMMDLLGTQSADYTQNVATTNLEFMRQGNSEIEMRQGVTANAETQNVILQPHNPFMNFGNSTVTSSGNFGNSTINSSGNFGNSTINSSGNFGNSTVNSSGNFGNPLNSFMNQGVISVNYGHLNNSVLHVGPGDIEGGDNSILNTNNFYGTVYRDIGTFGNSSIPQLSTHVANFGGQLPMNVSGIFPLNTSSLNNMSSLRPGSFNNAPVSVNFVDLGGSLSGTNLQAFNPASFNPASFNPASFNPASFNPTSFNPASFNPASFNPTSFNPTNFNPTNFNPTNFHCDFPLSIPTNHHVVSNQAPNLAAFSTSGLQDSLSNLISSSGINLFNAAVLPQNNEAMQGSSLGFINSFNTGLFPKF